MKTLCLLLLALSIITGCTHGPKKNLHNTNADTVKYAYKPDTNHRWIINEDPTNTRVVLSALKAEEKLDTAALRKYFAPSFVMNEANGSYKLDINELQKTMQEQAAEVKNCRIDVQDWQSVINEAGTEEWVNTWYTQYTTYRAGNSDTVHFTDHIRLKGGKIVQINEYTMQ